MSRGIRALAPAVTTAVVLVALTSAPAAADPAHDVPDTAVITLEGDGSGHGRGMSQYGAYSAARQGATYREILRTYYPRTRWKQLGGSIEVLVSGDDDRDLVVADTRGLTVRSVRSGRTWRTSVPRATRWRITRDTGARSIVSFHDGRWRTWKRVRGDVELTAGSGPLRLITPDGRVPYRGALRSSLDDHRERVSVNVLPLEQYLRGVVPAEMQAGWPQHALRAQAVAARTYAAWRRDHPLDVAYDICDTATCQVYGGAAVEEGSSDTAVRRTDEQVLTYRRRPVFAEYSASNGGHTVGGGKPYLPEMPDPYEGTSPDYYGWTVEVTAAQLERLYDLQDLTRIQVAERDATGRVARLELTTEGGDAPDTYPVDVARFVSSFGLRSSLFRVTEVD